jgi:aminoglycoside phosphotransferase (APT) family kinase protein
MVAGQMTMRSITDQLRQPIARALGVDDVVLTPAAGGAGNLAYEVGDAASPGTALAFLRCKLGDGGLRSMGYTLHREGELLRVAAGLGFPVAGVLGSFETPDGLLMAIVPGTSRPTPAEIEVVGAKYMALVGAVHASDSTLFPVTHYATISDALAADVAMWNREGLERRVMDEPLTALAGRVLADLIPPGPGRPALVHGDVGAGNFMCCNGEITAMLDWELAHLGDPHEDLAWLWIRGAHTDFGDPQTRFAEYETATGHSIDRQRLEWHVAFVMWKSVIAVQARARVAVPGELAMVQTMVRLTYDALLGAQLVRLLGGSVSLLTEQAVLASPPERLLADELLSVAVLEPDQRVVVEYLRDSSAQSEWERAELRYDCRSLLGIESDVLTSFVSQCPPELLLPAAIVVAGHAGRRAMAMPKAVRRIQRAHRIGLGSGVRTENEASR